MHIANTMLEMTRRVKYNYKGKMMCAGRKNSKEMGSMKPVAWWEEYQNQWHDGKRTKTSDMMGRELKACSEITTQNDAENIASSNRQQKNNP